MAPAVTLIEGANSGVGIPMRGLYLADGAVLSGFTVQKGGAATNWTTRANVRYGIAGGMLGPMLAVQVGMGESILILAFVVIVIGGIGSIRGAFLGALIVGVIDTAGRTLIPLLFAMLMSPEAAANAAPAVASIMIYVLMATVLFFRPRGLFPAHG